jgi:hypothetical protein
MLLGLFLQATNKATKTSLAEATTLKLRPA